MINTAALLQNPRLRYCELAILVVCVFLCFDVKSFLEGKEKRSVFFFFLFFFLCLGGGGGEINRGWEGFFFFYSFLLNFGEKF